MKKVCFVFLLALVCGCEPPAVAPQLKAAFNWQPGTYWIYRDSITGQVDSYAVADNIPVYNSYGGTSSITGYINVYQGGQPYPCFFTFNIYPYGMRIGGEQVPCGAYAPDRAVQIYLSPQVDSTSYFITDTLGSFTLAGNTFYHVQRYSSLYYDSALSHTIVTDQYYIDTAVGIIKMRLFDTIPSVISRVWELQRWKIMK